MPLPLILQSSAAQMTVMKGRIRRRLRRFEVPENSALGYFVAHFIPHRSNARAKGAPQPALELLCAHAVLEGFPPVDENDWNVVLKLFEQRSILFNVDFSDLEGDALLDLQDDLLRLLAKGAIRL